MLKVNEIKCTCKCHDPTNRVLHVFPCCNYVYRKLPVNIDLSTPGIRGFTMHTKPKKEAL